MMAGIGLLLIVAGVLLIIYAMQGETPFALTPYHPGEPGRKPPPHPGEPRAPTMPEGG